MKTERTFRVFEITDKGAFFYRLPHLSGNWATEAGDMFYGGCNGVTLRVTTPGFKSLHFGIDQRGHARLVGRVVITKLK